MEKLPPPRALIYSFLFEEAASQLGDVNSGIPEKLRQRLEKAVAYNKASPLSQKSRVSVRGLEPAGRWWPVWPTEKHLRIKGVVDAECERVGIFVNDRLVKLVNTVPRHDDPANRRVFRFNIKPDIMKVMPKKTVIGVGSEHGYLRVRNGGISYRNHLLRGNARIFKLLDSGYFLSKKGRLQKALDHNEAWKTSALDAYTEFREYFESTFDYKPFIICGTLLGYFREGDFIAHDDDMDVAYFSRETRPEDVKREMAQIVARMLRDGFDIKFAKKPGFFKPHVRGLSFDVFPMWFDEDSIWMMNTTRQRTAPSRIMPIGTGVFRGIEVYVPNNVEDYIVDEYGPNWRVPDPGYRSVGEPGTAQYLLRSCLTVDEVKELYESVLEEKRQGHATGELTVAERDIDAWTGDV